MAQSYHDNPSHNAPEVNHQSNSLHAVADYTQAQPLTTAKEPYYHPSPTIETYAIPTKPGKEDRWKRWWALALMGLLIAPVAGLVGGFIGQAIEKGRATCTSSDSTLATVPVDNAPRTATGIMVNANTGCNFESRERRRIDNRTEVSRTSYTTVCNSEWDSFGNGDDILGFIPFLPRTA